jgi:hypothetical protein
MIYSGGTHIPFSEIFGMNLTEYEDFSHDAKRTYVNQWRLIADSNNKIIKLDRDNEILVNYLLISNKINRQKYRTPESFIVDMVQQILKPWFLDAIDGYVREQYVPQSNVDVERIDPSLVFTDEHCILLYKMAHVYRFIIPLTTHFAKVYSDMISNQDTSEFYIDAYGTTYKNAYDAMTYGEKLFNRTTFLLRTMSEVITQLTKNTPEINIYGKLYNYIINIVKGTAFSDAEMWHKLIMRSTSKYNQVDIIMAKILIDIIPKANFANSIIVYIVTSAENHIKWGFRQDFLINFNMISPMSENSDFTDADKFDINSVKTDELKKVLQDNFMSDTIDIIFERKQFIMPQYEYDWYLKHNKIHPVQDFMIRNYFANEFGGYENLEGLNIFQYTRLFVYLHTMLNDGQYTVLPKIFSGHIVTVNEKRLLPRPIERKIRESTSYQNILMKYQYTGQVFAKSNVIEQFIITILNSKILYNGYGNKRNDSPIEIETDIVCAEILRFFENI